MTSYDPRYLEFFELFNQEEFFEAHEALECLWLETVGENRGFYQGLIQLAALFVHVRNQNFAGAEKLYKTASAHLEGYPEPCEGISISDLLKIVRESLDQKKLYPKIPKPIASERD